VEYLADSPGTIALPTSEVGRFLLFTVSLASTDQPPGCYLNASASASVTENINSIFRQLRDDDRWVWIMGDDHCWPRDTLVKLLRTLDRHPEIDVLVPLVLKRNPPWHPVVFRETGQVEEGYHDTPTFDVVPWNEIPESGVFEIDAAGSAGMLIRREVIEAVPDPWFYSTTDRDGRQVVLNEDVTFCTRIRREHGMRIFATADAVLGHLGIFNVRPFHNGERWGALTEFATTEERLRHVFMPVDQPVEEPVGV
jgi:hypothetical protein